MKAAYRILLACIGLFMYAQSVLSQDTLPNFSAKEIGINKVQISWCNPYESCVQLAVQRSYDSLHFFNTIYAAQSPTLPQNGFVDTKPNFNRPVFYRIFYMLNGGVYFFTKSKQAIPANSRANNSTNINPIIQPTVVTPTIITIYKKTTDNILVQLDYNAYRKFADSIITKTKDTFRILSATESLIKPFVPKPIWVASKFVYINKSGVVNIRLPMVKKHRYSIVFYEENGDELFAMKSLKEDDLIIEKSNFMHAGWFYFELYEDEILKERNKFFLEKQF